MLLVIVGGILQLVGIGWCSPFVGARGLVPGVPSVEQDVGNQPAAIPLTGILRILLKTSRVGEQGHTSVFLHCIVGEQKGFEKHVASWNGKKGHQQEK